MLKKWVIYIKRWISYRDAVREAKARRTATFKKQHVIFWRGKFEVVSRQRLKQLHSDKIFKKGVSMKDLNRIIYYTTK